MEASQKGNGPPRHIQIHRKTMNHDANDDGDDNSDDSRSKTTVSSSSDESSSSDDEDSLEEAEQEADVEIVEINNNGNEKKDDEDDSGDSSSNSVSSSSDESSSSDDEDSLEEAEQEDDVEIVEINNNDNEKKDDHYKAGQASYIRKTEGIERQWINHPMKYFSRKEAIMAFPEALYRMIEYDREAFPYSCIAWCSFPTNSFMIVDPARLERDLLPKLFYNPQEPLTLAAFFNLLDLFGFTRKSVPQINLLVYSHPFFGRQRESWSLRAMFSLYVSRAMQRITNAPASTTGTTYGRSAAGDTVALNSSPVAITVSDVPRSKEPRQLKEAHPEVFKDKARPVIASPKVVIHPVEVTGPNAPRPKEPIVSHGSFPKVLYEMLQYASTSTVSIAALQYGVSWCDQKVHQEQRGSFVITNHKQFVNTLLQKFFPRQSFEKFESNLYLYGFRRIYKTCTYWWHQHFCRQRPYSSMQLSIVNRDEGGKASAAAVSTLSPTSGPEQVSKSKRKTTMSKPHSHTQSPSFSVNEVARASDSKVSTSTPMASSKIAPFGWKGKDRFPEILYKMLDETSSDPNEYGIRWCEPQEHRQGIGSFVVTDPKKVVAKVFPKYFPNQSVYRSFERLLNMWCFVRRGSPKKITYPAYYFHSYFQKGRLDWCHKFLARDVTKFSEVKDRKLGMTINLKHAHLWSQNSEPKALHGKVKELLSSRHGDDNDETGTIESKDASYGHTQSQDCDDDDDSSQFADAEEVTFAEGESHDVDKDALVAVDGGSDDDPPLTTKAVMVHEETNITTMMPPPKKKRRKLRAGKHPTSTTTRLSAFHYSLHHDTAMGHGTRLCWDYSSDNVDLLGIL